jgi:serine/threonine protein kinase
MEKGGKSLSKFIAESKLHVDVVKALAALRQIFELLKKLHSTGLVHRDVKSINVIFASPDGKDPLKDKLVLIDFEYARTIGEGCTRAEDIHEAIHIAVKMNPIFKLLFPNYRSFPGTEPYAVRESLLSKGREALKKLEERFGPIADEFKTMMAELYSIAPPMTGPGIHATPEYDMMITLLRDSIALLSQKRKNKLSKFCSCC